MEGYLRKWKLLVSRIPSKPNCQESSQSDIDAHVSRKSCALFQRNDLEELIQQNEERSQEGGRDSSENKQPDAGRPVWTHPSPHPSGRVQPWPPEERLCPIGGLTGQLECLRI